ncbi:hypothetical protein [Chryseobacterium camelliae]|uniref:hypothetical protein n=1 Tax=Chryseobacterium camelliae TaxID=1265445 RepID=UPI0028671442|nr:hypothetical protein [Chryseobacterium camelliae]MDR6515555.1 hypothetical protein [Chryseobacterium camelliae]
MKKLFLLFLTAFTLFSCSSDDDTIYDFIGTWSGSYAGNDKGTWNIVVATDGKVTGTMHSDQNNENYNISGYLTESGELSASVGLPSDGEFRGNLGRDKKASGTWRNSVPNPDRAGDWTGEKNK